MRVSLLVRDSIAALLLGLVRSLPRPTVTAEEDVSVAQKQQKFVPVLPAIRAITVDAMPDG